MLFFVHSAFYGIYLLRNMRPAIRGRDSPPAAIVTSTLYPNVDIDASDMLFFYCGTDCEAMNVMIRVSFLCL